MMYHHHVQQLQVDILSECLIFHNVDKRSNSAGQAEQSSRM